MSVAANSPLTSANTNAAFVSKITDSTMVGKLTLNKVSEGASIDSVQKAILKIYEGLGTTGESDTSINSYASNHYITDGDDRKEVIEDLDAQLFLTQTQVDDHENRLDTIETLDSTFSGNKTFANNVIVNGNLTVNGTTTTVNSATLDVADKNITINNGGSDLTAEGAGLTIERTGTSGSLVYENALASKFKIGDLGSEVQIADVSSTQTFTNKTINASSNTITNITNTEISSSAAIAYSKLAALSTGKALQSNSSTGFVEASSVTNTELSYLTGVTSNIQTQINSIGSGITFSVASKTANYTLVSTDYLILADTTGGAFTLTLPTAVGNTGKQFVIKRTNQALASILTVDTTSSQTIDGVTTTTLNTQYEQIMVISDGANWQLLSRTFNNKPVSFSPTVVGLGTITGSSFTWRRIGNAIEVLGSFTTGTPTAVTVQIPLPSGLTVGTTTTKIVGHGGIGRIAPDALQIIATNGESFLKASANNSSVSGNVAGIGTTFPGGTTLSFAALVEITGWN